jgi:hypothetical protein
MVKIYGCYFFLYKMAGFFPLYMLKSNFTVFLISMVATSHLQHRSGHAGNGGPAEVGEAAGKGGASCLNGCF